MPCRGVSGSGPLVLIDDVPADWSSRNISEVYSAVLSAQMQAYTAKLTAAHR